MGSKILVGNNIEKLKEIESESVDCIVSSPPYFGLRDYGTGKWEGGDSNCPHKRLTKISKDTSTGHAGMYEQGHVVGDAIYKQICPECGAKRVDDQFGLEETLEEYIEKTVLLFEELRRVLKPQGTVWWNIGDSYASKSSAFGGRGKNSILNNTSFEDKQRRNTIVPEGLKAKDLMMIPARVAIALSENGWYLRSEIIWHKPNPMPESVKDRPTSAHEKIYLFSKNKKYYYDADAIREKAKTKPTVRNKSAEGYQADYAKGKRFSEGERTYGNGYANKRNVWESDEKKPYRIIDEKFRNPIVEYRDLPSQKDIRNYLSEQRKKKGITIDNIEKHFGNQAGHHWFEKDGSYPSKEDWLELKKLLDLDDTYDKVMTTIKYKSGLKQDHPLGKNKRNVWDTKYESDEEERMYRQGMSKTRGENVVFVRTKLPTQKDFVKFIKERTSIKQLDEETDIKKTTIEHWFRNDESGFAFPSVEDWKVIKDYVNDWSKEFELIDEGLTYVESHLDSIESNPLGKNKRNVWTVTTKPFRGAHFAVFPPDLIEPCIKAGCPKGGTVLDPFGGSGTTGLVANNLGRNAILIELNEEYVEIAKKRLGEDLGLFSEVEDG